MDALSGRTHRMTLWQRAELWLLNLAERRIIPLLPRGTLRNQLRAHIDRSQAHLHSRVHDHGERP
jgi:hypothetical protein